MENFCVLIPSYNETRTIGSIVRVLKTKGVSAVYVVDDGSTDGTSSAAKAEGAIVLRHERNEGKGAALREGFRHVLDSPFDAVVVMDADMQHEVDDIDMLLAEMRAGSADLVIGNRMRDTASMPPVRVFTNRFMSAVISAISGQDIPDTQCGFRLIRRNALKKMTLESSNYEIESEMILEAARLGCRIRSVPIKTVYGSGPSRIDPVLDTIRFFAFLLKRSLGHRRA